MKKIIYLYIFFMLSIKVQAQNVTINPNGITPLSYGNHPRISYAAILNIPNPQEGDLAFDTTNKCLRIYINGVWVCSYEAPPTNPTGNDQTFLASAGGNGSDVGSSIATDANGNIYITGKFSNYSATFGAIVKTNQGGSDIFLAKYNSNGNVEWVQSAGGTSNDFPNKIAIDGNGDIYMVGNYNGTATFGTMTITSSGGQGTFMAKYSSNGDLVWLRAMPAAAHAVAITIDTNNSLYISGSYTGTITLGTETMTSQGGGDIFLAKYNSSGNIQWANSAGGIGTETIGDMILDSNNNLYIVGNYSGHTSFGSTSSTSQGQSDVFLAKYDTIAQNWSWLQAAGGTNHDSGIGVGVDNNNNVYITGHYQGIGTFGSSTIVSQGSYDVFVAKYNSGGSLLWVQSAGGSQYDLVYGMDVNAVGNVCITGMYSGTTLFGTYAPTATGNGSCFVASYNSGGTCQWMQSIKGSNYVIGEEVDIRGEYIYVTGYFNGTALFGSTTKSSTGAQSLEHDMFLVRIN